jgi:hypothetical protein
MPAAAQQDCFAKNPKPICSMPSLNTNQAGEGFVFVTGHWTPEESGMFEKNSAIEITCIKAKVEQVSHSPIGFCIEAMGFVSTFNPLCKDCAMVVTNYFDIAAWEKTSIIAETHARVCETQHLVVDFPSNSVTLTSNLSFTGKCADADKGSKPALVFSLVRSFEFASKDLNPFLK